VNRDHQRARSRHRHHDRIVIRIMPDPAAAAIAFEPPVDSFGRTGHLAGLLTVPEADGDIDPRRQVRLTHFPLGGICGIHLLDRRVAHSRHPSSFQQFVACGTEHDAVAGDACDLIWHHIAIGSEFQSERRTNRGRYAPRFLASDDVAIASFPCHANAPRPSTGRALCAIGTKDAATAA